MLTIDMPLPGHVLVGLSGGADSVALAYLLMQRKIRLTAVHVNHSLRGDDSDGDERFVAALCEMWRIPLLTYRAAPPAHPSEDWARQVRYAFFREALAASGADALALAHHRDDQAETVLLHLLRGSGLTGLCAMPEDAVIGGMRILRPLLGVTRQQLRSLLLSIGQNWREDGSNGDPRYLRNALRGEVLPLLEQLVPGASAHLAQTARLLRGDEATLDLLTARFLAEHGGQRHLPLPALRQEPEGMQRRILRTWWTNVTPPTGERSLSAPQTEAFAALLTGKAGSTCNLPGGWHGQRGWTHLHLLPPTADPHALPEMPLAHCPLLTLTPANGTAGDGKRCQALPASMLAGLTIRTRQAGDWLIPFGSTGRKSLQDYLVDRRIDAPFRDSVPLLCRGSEVLLAGGVGAGSIPRMTDTNDHVLLTWKADFPWCSTC